MKQSKKLPDLLKMPMVKYNSDYLNAIQRQILFWINGTSDKPDFETIMAANLKAQELDRWIALYEHLEGVPVDTDLKSHVFKRVLKENYKGFDIVDTPPKKPGNHVWVGIKGFCLYADIYKHLQRNKDKNDIGLNAACRDIAKNGKYGQISGETLKTRYFEIRNHHGKEKLALLNPIIDSVQKDENENPFDDLDIPENLSLCPAEFVQNFMDIYRLLKARQG
ncbi:MAG: hypothetical protein R3E13_02050 [Alphaproteobacteria bacterium]